MPESNQGHHQTEFKGTTSGIYSTGSGDVNVLVANLGNAIKVIKKLIPNKDVDAIEKLTEVLHQHVHYQKVISEIKQVHNMLHRLETALAVIESSIRITIEQKTLSIYAIQDSWRIAVRPQIQDMQNFASNEMKFLEERSFIITSDKIVGPDWIVNLIVLYNDFETTLKEGDVVAIYDLSRNLLDVCRENLFHIDRKLLESINKLDQFSNQILSVIDQ